MQSEQQQRIMGYFIEEAKDHLNTIEQGLLNLQGTIEDSDLVNEVFRAAHSVKGGAAMLGLDSIQQTAHRLEDYFKVLKECPLKVDQKLETLFLRVFDTLQDLLEQLQGPFGLTDDNAAQIMGDVEPVLSELHVHLNHLVEASGHTPPEDVDLSQPVPPAVSATSTRAGASKQEDSALTLYFQSDVPAQLRNMLGLFKQPDTAFVRQQLQDICSDLAQAGESFDLHPNWSELSSLAQRAIANPDNDFRQLAPALIKDFKQAQDRVLSGRSADITPSYALQEMQPVADVFTEDVPVLSSEDLLDDMTDFLSGSSDASMESDAADDPFASLAGLEDGDESSEDDGADFDLFGEETDSLDLNTDNLELDELVANNGLDLSTRAIATPARQGPHVGTAELNSLADLFENEAPELNMDWQEEVIDNSSDLMVEGLVLDASNDFSDLLFDEAPPEQKGASHDADDISGILDSIEESSPLPSPPSVVAEDEFADLFSVGTSSDDSLPELAKEEANELDNLNAFFDDIDEEGTAEEDTLDIPSLDDDNASISPEFLVADPHHETDHENLEASLFGTDVSTDDPSNTSQDSDGLDDLFLNSLSDDALLSTDDTDEPSENVNGLDASSLNNLDGLDVDDLWDSSPTPTPDRESEDEFNVENPFASSEDSNNDDELDQLLADEFADDSQLSIEADDLGTDNLDMSNDLSSLEDGLDSMLGMPEMNESNIDSAIESVEMDRDLEDFDTAFNASTEPESFDLGDSLGNLLAEHEEATTPSHEASDDDSLLNDLLSGDDFGLEAQDTGISSSVDSSLDDLLTGEDIAAENQNPGGASDDDIDALFSNDELALDNDDVGADIMQELPEGLLTDLSEEIGNDSDVAMFTFDDEPAEGDLQLEELNELDELENLGELTDLGLDTSLELDVFSSENTSAEADETNFSEENITVDIDDLNTIENQETPALENADGSIQEADSNAPNDVIDLGLDNLDDISLSDLDLADAELSGEQDVDSSNETNSFDDFTEAMFIDTSDSVELEETNGFEELNILLENSEEESEFELDTSSEHDDDNFDDLDALLSANDSSDLSDPQRDDQVSSSLLASNPDEDFDDLEALLDSPSELSMAEPLDIDASDDEDFSDLEKLLEDADQKLVAPPTTKTARGASPMSGRRPTRRGGSGYADQNMRVSVKNLDNLNNLVGELVVNRNSLEQSQERLRQFLDNMLYQVQQLSDVGQRMRDLYERSLLESSLLSSRRSYQLANQAGGGMATSKPADSTHATGASFDALEMDRFTGFHTLSQEMIELIVRVREAASDIDFVVDESDQTTRMFRQVTTQLQEGLTRSRMVAFAQAATRLPRAVRDISIKCGKQAELLVEGKDTLIDKMILEQLYDPMTHLVNNAITHGIETPEERHALHKPPVGKITIRVFHQGNQTIISVTDDGAGINPEVVKAKALQRGLISPEEAEGMNRLDIYDLLFHHGFSTRDQADDFAGRGVGMDVVRTSLNEIRGVINIDSTVGQGTTFTIRLPLTLSISKALLCVSNRARIAFPMDGVEDMLDVPSDRIQNDEEGRPSIYWRDIVLPFYPLAELLKYHRMMGRGSVYGGNQEDDVISVVVLRSAGNYLALQVDQVLGEQEIVIKQLEAPIPKPAGIAGATVLGDGRIMPIADVLELIDLSLGRIRKEVGTSLWEQEAARIASTDIVEAKSEPTVLIVDDSITVRELLSMTFNKVGYRVEQARDGQEAWEKLKSGLPCELVFCDIEMPRMDGLELLSRLQKDTNLKKLPIAMLTSRGADRHRQMAVQLGAKGYFTKPYLEEVLLDAAQRMLNGEVLIGNA